MSDFCPCQSGSLYKNCCGPFLMKKEIPATPEALMRSRYTAYAEGDMDYIEKTMRMPAAKNFNKKEAEISNQSIRWCGLNIVFAKTEGEKGWVEFIASYSFEDKTYQLHELSEFTLLNKQWYYIDGKIK